jgi:hypothetical protein
VDLVTPEFKFRIESVGAEGKSPLAKWVPSLRKPSPATPVEESSRHHSTSADSAKKKGEAKP